MWVFWVKVKGIIDKRHLGFLCLLPRTTSGFSCFFPAQRGQLCVVLLLAFFLLPGTGLSEGQWAQHSGQAFWTELTKVWLYPWEELKMQRLEHPFG